MDGEIPVANRALETHKEHSLNPPISNQAKLSKAIALSEKASLPDKILNNQLITVQFDNLRAKNISQDVDDIGIINKVRDENLNLSDAHLESIKQNINSLGRQLEFNTKEITSQNSLYENLAKKIDLLEELKSQVSDPAECDKIEEEIESLVDEMLEIEDRLEILQKEHKKAEVELSKAQAELSKVQDKLSSVNNKLQEFIQSETKLELEKDTSLTMNEEVQEEIKDEAIILDTHIDTKESEIEEQKEEISEKKEERETSKAKLKEEDISEKKAIKTHIKAENKYEKAADKVLKPKGKKAKNSLVSRMFKISKNALEGLKNFRKGLLEHIPKESMEFLDLVKNVEAEVRSFFLYKREGHLEHLPSESMEFPDSVKNNVETEVRSLFQHPRDGLSEGKQSLEHLSDLTKSILLNKGFIKSDENGLFTIQTITDEDLINFLESIQDEIIKFYENNPVYTVSDEIEEKDEDLNKEPIGPTEQHEELSSTNINNNEVVKLFILGQKEKAAEKFLFHLLEVQQNKAREESETLRQEQQELEKLILRQKHIEKQELNREMNIKEHYEEDFETTRIEKYEHAKEIVIQSLSVKEIRNFLLSSPKGIAIIKKIEEKIKRIERVEKLPQDKFDRLLNIVTEHAIDFIIRHLPAIGVNLTTGVDPYTPGTTTTRGTTNQ